MILSIILIIGLALRLYNNTSIALWHDEAFSALYLTYDWREMMHRIALDVHPPLYYVLLKFWNYFAGDSLFALRLLSILFGVLTVWAVYLFVKAALQNKKLAILSALLVALNPFQIQYALEARMYTLGTFLLIWSSYFLVKAIEGESGKQKKYWIAYGITTAAGLYTHYYLIFSVAAQAFFILYAFFKQKKLKILIGAAGAYILAFILYLPWLGTFWEQTRRVQANFWIPPLDRWSIPGTVWKMTFGGGGINRPTLVIATLISLVLLIYFVKRVSNYNKWQVILGVLGPFFGAILLSYFTNLYLDRFFVFASLFFTITIIGALYQIPKRTLRWFFVISLALGTIFAFFKNWEDLDAKNKPGMAATAEFINQNTKKDDKIFAGSSFIFFTFKYYNQTQTSPLLYVPGGLESIPHFSGTALLSRQDLITDFSQTEKGSTVWLLWTTGFGGAKPQAPKNWKQIKEIGFEDTPGFKGKIFVTQYSVN